MLLKAPFDCYAGTPPCVKIVTQRACVPLSLSVPGRICAISIDSVDILRVVCVITGPIHVHKLNRIHWQLFELTRKENTSGSN
jgi:hypothetical protein